MKRKPKAKFKIGDIVCSTVLTTAPDWVNLFVVVRAPAEWYVRWRGDPSPVPLSRLTHPDAVLDAHQSMMRRVTQYEFRRANTREAIRLSLEYDAARKRLEDDRLKYEKGTLP